MSLSLPFKVKALYAYHSDHPDDLSFQPGQIIEVSEVEDEEWYSGSLADDPSQSGMFPRNFVDKIAHEVDNTNEVETHEIEQPSTSPVMTSSFASKQAQDSPVMKDTADSDVAEVERKMNKMELAPPAEQKSKNNAFADRIAAFNNNADSPPVPLGQQPKQRSFVNKPFVPGPSSFVPDAPKSPPPVDEPRVLKPVEKAATDEPRQQQQQQQESEEPEEDVPKMSLKERIRMLQHQQEEEQARAEAAAQKKKARADAKAAESKKHETEKVHAEVAEVQEPEAKLEKQATGGEELVEDQEPELHELQEEKTHEPVPVAEPTLEPEAKIVKDIEQESDKGEEQEEEDEEDEDEEEARRIALRERMAKLSAGGMGMGGMGGMGMMMPGFGAPPPAPKPKPKKKEPEPESDPEDRPAPVAVMPFADPKALKKEAVPPPPQPVHDEEPEERLKSPPPPPLSREVPPPVPRPIEPNMDSESEQTPVVHEDAPRLPPLDTSPRDDDELGDDERTESDDARKDSKSASSKKRLSYVAGGAMPPIPAASPPPPKRSSTFELPTASPPQLQRYNTMGNPLSPSHAPPPPPPPHPPVPHQREDEATDATTGYDADEDTDMNVTMDEEPRNVPPPPPPPPLPTRSPPMSPVDKPESRPPPPPPPHLSQEPVERQTPPPPPAAMRPPPPPPPPPPAPPAPVTEGSRLYDEIPHNQESDTTEDDYVPPLPQAPPPPPMSPPPQQPISAQSTGPLSAQSTGRSSVDKSRMSIDRSRTSIDPSHRMSMDSSSGSGGIMAHELDLEEDSNWWAQPNGIPPSIQKAKNLAFEIEDQKTPKRGGRTLIVREIYILYQDYSQTQLTARFEQHNPSSVSFEQEHLPPPPALRQDQLEDAYDLYGKQVFTHAQHLANQQLSPGEFVPSVIRQVPNTLPSIANKSHGALIYSNMANATVRQFDEIRPGDVLTFRNARFQGHKGSLHQKYSLEAGQQRVHSAIVQEWDGTKRKVRVFEQSEKGKVKQESYRLSDLKSGEVKAFRVLGRDYVGWD